MLLHRSRRHGRGGFIPAGATSGLRAQPGACVPPAFPSPGDAGGGASYFSGSKPWSAPPVSGFLAPPVSFGVCGAAAAGAGAAGAGAGAGADGSDVEGATAEFWTAPPVGLPLPPLLV